MRESPLAERQFAPSELAMRHGSGRQRRYAFAEPQRSCGDTSLGTSTRAVRSDATAFVRALLESSKTEIDAPVHPGTRRHCQAGQRHAATSPISHRPRIQAASLECPAGSPTRSSAAASHANSARSGNLSRNPPRQRMKPQCAADPSWRARILTVFMSANMLIFVRVVTARFCVRAPVAPALQAESQSGALRP